MTITFVNSSYQMYTDAVCHLILTQSYLANEQSEALRGQ